MTNFIRSYREEAKAAKFPKFAKGILLRIRNFFFVLFVSSR